MKEMKTKILTLVFFAFTLITNAQAPQKIWSNSSDPRTQAIRDFARGYYLDCIMNCQKLSALGMNDGLVSGLMAMAFDSLSNNDAAKKSNEVASAFQFDSSILKRLAASDLSPEIYQRNLLSKASEAYNKGDFASSEQSFKEFLKLAPKDTFATFFLGNSQFYQQKYDEAIASYKHVLDLDFNRADVHNLTGVCYLLQNNYLTARDYFSQASILDKHMAVAFYNLGRVHYGLQDKNAALQSLTSAYAFAPKDSGCVALLAQIYLEQSDDKNAEKFLAKLYALNRNNERIGWNLVNLSLKNKDYEHASAYLQNLIRVNPKNAEAYNKLSETYINMNSYEQAFINYENAIAKMGESRDFLYGAGSCANKIGLYGKALEYLGKAQTLDVSFAKTYQAMGDAYMGMKKKKDAKKNYKLAVNFGYQKDVSPTLAPPSLLTAKN